MAFENIQIEHGNFTVKYNASTFFTLDHENQRLIEKSSSGTVIFNYLLDATILEVQSLQFDGYYFWSLERQSTSGFRVRKWELGSDDILHLEQEFGFISDSVNHYDTRAMAVEGYSDTLDNLLPLSTSTFDVVDGSIITIGDRLVIGPSTAVGYEGLFSFTTVIGKPSDTTVQVSPAVDKTFNPNDPLYFTRSFFVFSDTAPGNQRGALYKFRYTDGFPLSLDVSSMYDNVRGATFFKGKLQFVKAGEVIWLNPDSQTIFRVQAIDNLNAARTEYHTTHDLTGASNTLYRLEQQHVYYNSGTNSYLTESWSPLYNYNTSSTIPEVYFVAVKAEPPLLHRQVAGIPASELKATITVTVLDQFRVPVFNRLVDLTSDGGPLSSIQETTDINGQIKVEYTADSGIGDVIITAVVT